jgi:hypothetical protein
MHRSIRHFGLVLLVAMLAPFVAQAATLGTVASRAFQGWTATCNNLGTCVLIGTDETDAFFYLRIARAAGATAEVSAKVVLAVQEPLAAAAPDVSLTAVTNDKAKRALGPFPTKPDADRTTFPAEIGAGAASLALVDAIRNADRLDYRLANKAGTLDLKGLSAALRWIDAQQGRAGTPTALVAKGMTPIGQVPNSPPPPVVAAAPAGSARELNLSSPPKAVLAAAAAVSDCDQETVAAHQGAQAWQLRPNLILYALPCSNGAYNFMSVLFTADAKGGSVAPQTLPLAAGDDRSGLGNLITNGTFDPQSLVLTDFSKGRGVGDCGETRSWLWTGKGFALLSADRLDSCPGALSDDWPNVFTAVRK